MDNDFIISFTRNVFPLPTLPVTTKDVGIGNLWNNNNIYKFKYCGLCGLSE